MNAIPSDTMVSSLARAFGISPEQADAVVGRVMPEFSYEMEKLSMSRGGLADLLEMIGSGNGVAREGTGAELAGDDVRRAGNQFLGTILGSKYRSRVLAARAGKDAGLDDSVVKKMLPAIASLVIGRAGGETNRSIGRLTDSMAIGPGADDGRFRGHEPLPIPGDDIPGLGQRSGGNSYRDLSDILRRTGGGGGGGGGSVGGAPNGGYLWSIVRNILGSALGFQSQGIMGWIIRFVVYRYGWSILKMLFGRLVPMGR